MCGITGFWARKGDASRFGETIRSMTDTLTHRGPDASGVWIDEPNGVAFGHRRLSILDLSENGSQPMLSSDRRYAIVYNGEVYNFKELKSRLNHTDWKGDSDTEVIINAVSEWGIRKTIESLNGMFAMAIWDRSAQRLTLVRDRMGIKPLYYGWLDNTFVFASELKAIRQHPKFERVIDLQAVGSVLAAGYIVGPRSIYENIKKLPPGCFTHLDSTASETRPQEYWSIRAAIERAHKTRFNGDLNDAANELDRLLRTAVKSRMISDVPLGAFLSGGIDSSTVVAMMQSESSIPIKTFSIGFREEKYNEAPFAHDVAKHLGCDHTELIADPLAMIDLIPQLSKIYDEPFADHSQLPTLLVSELARQHVTVTLSGDGGDELFGGYTRYSDVLSRWGRIRYVPTSIRRLLGGGLARFAETKNAVSSRLRTKRIGRQLSSRDLKSLYEESITLDPSFFMRNANDRCRILDELVDPFPSSSNGRYDLHRLMYFDSCTYLPDDILVKVDRASMNHSLEARVPLLDHQVVEFAMTLRDEHRNSDKLKSVIRRVLKKYVPESLTDRPKRGFGVPIGEWLKTPLRDWAESCLTKNQIDDVGLFSYDAVNAIWNEHIKGVYNWECMLWRIIAVQEWAR